MNEATPPSDPASLPERPTIAALLNQLGGDAVGFARAEAELVRAQAGERANFAKPALAMLGTGLALLFGLAMAVPVGVMLVLAPLIGSGWALAAVLGGGVVISLACLKFGARRLKAAFKPPEAR